MWFLDTHPNYIVLNTDTSSLNIFVSQPQHALVSGTRVNVDFMNQLYMHVIVELNVGRKTWAVLNCICQNAWQSVTWVT